MKTITARSAGGVIVDRDGRVVLTARRTFKGDIWWGLPKGIIEKGERPEQAALREAQEETGLEVEMVRPITTIDYWFVEPREGGDPPIRVHKFVDYFLMRPIGGDPESHDAETVEVALLEPAEALERVSYESEADVIRAALE